MIRGHAAMRAADVDGPFHLVDLAQPGWPLLGRCGAVMPDPMGREVRSARFVPVELACLDCVVAASGDDRQQLGRPGLTA